MHKSDQKKSAQETSKKKNQSGQERGKRKESHCQNCMSMGISRKTVKSGKESCRGTVKRCTQIRRRRENHREKLNTSKRKEINSSQWMVERQRSQLTWCYKPGQRCLTTRSSSKFMKDCGVLAKTRRRTKEEDQKLQGNCADIGDVEVVRVLYYSASGTRNRT